MLHTNLFVRNGRVICSRFVGRGYCKEKALGSTKLGEKFYIIRLKNQHETALVKADQPSIKGDHWHRLRLVLEEIFYIYRNQFSRKVKDLHVEERIVEMRRRQAEKLSAALTQENIKKIVDSTQSQLKSLKDSRGYEKIQKLPALSKEVVAKGNRYWILFSGSKYKDLLIYYVQLGKKGVTEVLQFIKLVYKAPSKQ